MGPFTTRIKYIIAKTHGLDAYEDVLCDEGAIDTTVIRSE